MQKGFIQFGIIIAITAVLLIGGAKYMSYRLSSDSSEIIERVTTVTTTPNETAPIPKTILCNGTYYTQCEDNLKFVCPKAGRAYCETPMKNSPASVVADTLLCNGKGWLKCPQGYNFYCPAQGDAQCVPQPSVSDNAQVDIPTPTSMQQSSQSEVNIQAEVARKQKGDDILRQILSYLDNLNSKITQTLDQLQQKEYEIKSIKQQSIPQPFVDAQVAKAMSEYDSLLSVYDGLISTKEKLQTITYEVQDYRDYGTPIPATSRSFLASFGIYW